MRSQQRRNFGVGSNPLLPFPLTVSTTVRPFFYLNPVSVGFRLTLSPHPPPHRRDPPGSSSFPFPLPLSRTPSTPFETHLPLYLKHMHYLQALFFAFSLCTSVLPVAGRLSRRSHGELSAALNHKRSGDNGNVTVYGDDPAELHRRGDTKYVFMHQVRCLPFLLPFVKSLTNIRVQIVGSKTNDRISFV